MSFRADLIKVIGSISFRLKVEKSGKPECLELVRKVSESRVDLLDVLKEISLSVIKALFRGVEL